VLDSCGVTEADERTGHTADTELGAWRAIFEAEPTTMAGLIALLRYAAEPYDEWGNRADAYRGIHDEPDVYGFIADSLERLAVLA
jgi:hypothetical protein